MRIEKADFTANKGWYAGPWNSDLTIAVGYANEGVDEPHVHRRVTEVYLIARGTAEMRVEQETIILHAGDMLIVEPGEAHTFLTSSPDYFHFVAHVPGLPGKDKVHVDRSRLGL